MGWDGEKSPVLNSATPVELRGYGVEQGIAVYTATMKRNTEAEDKTSAHLNYAMAAIFYAAILVQNSQKLGELTLDLARVATETFPDNLALRFNAARAFWTFGLRDEAVGQFDYILDHFNGMEFNPRSDALFSHRVRPLAEMFSYGDYYRAVMADLQSDGTKALDMILSGACTYLGAAAFEDGDADKAIALCKRAIALTEVNFPAYGLQARALFAKNENDGDILPSFYKTINLYPPAIDELLEVGLKSELGNDNENAAREILVHWLLYHWRVREADGSFRPVNQNALAAAEQNRNLLPDGLTILFDELLAGTAQ